MKRKINRDKKREVLLLVSGKQQFLKILSYYGELDALQSAVDFLQKEIGTSEKEIIRLLNIGIQKVRFNTPKTTQQALDQLAWLIIIQGKLNDICDRIRFLKGKIPPKSLKDIIMQALDISKKIFETKSIRQAEEAIIDAIMEYLT